jgi:hypothetical protein
MHIKFIVGGSIPDPDEPCILEKKEKMIEVSLFPGLKGGEVILF